MTVDSVNRDERWFGPADHDPVLITEPGLILVGDLGWLPAAQPAGASSTGAPLWWTPTFAGPTAVAAFRLVGQPHVCAVTIIPAGAQTDRIGLACAFGSHLAAVRNHRRLPGAWITSPEMPDPPAAALRLPHLVTVTAPGSAEDVIVWELMTVEEARRWLERPLPTEAFADLVEQNLARLLRIRAAARAGRLPGTPAGTRLAQLLAHSYLSIRFVYQHPDLFADLLTEGNLQ